MENKNLPAYPTTETEKHDFGKIIRYTKNEYLGLTKREYFAAMALQGLISSIGSHDVTDKDELAHDAVGLADALLKQLNP